MNGTNTIEPRLIALLSDGPQAPFGASPSLELPPLHDPNILKASGRPLLLEPDASERNGKPASKTQLGPAHTTILPPLDEDENTYKNDERKKKAESSGRGRALGGSSPQFLRKILDGGTENTATISAKKRHMVEPNKDDFVQLPQPPKKQKTAKQVVPPIIIGLFEPPPQAALFPPIASSSFHDSHGRNTLNTVPLKAKVVKETSKSDASSSNEKTSTPSKSLPKRKNAGTRNKWTEQETNNLLLGVHKHGVGCWTDILGDPSFSFNGRSAADLKDRFRTCCPAEMRRTGQSEGTSEKSKPKKNKSSLMSENILIEDSDLGIGAPESFEPSHKTRAHRKKMEDLAQLGIEGPFRMSQRRERRPFSDSEDRAILEGYNIYGFAWVKMQRDPQLNLQSRRPTDLRDRFRNRYPQKFKEGKMKDPSSFRHFMRSENMDVDKTLSHQRQEADGRSGESAGKESNSSSMRSENKSAEKTSSGHGQETDVRPSEAAGKESTTGPSAPQPSLHSLPSREGLRIKDITSTESLGTFADQPSMDSSDNLAFGQSFDWNHGTTAPFSNGIGEMDISRLLLDEGWDSTGREKQSFSDSNNILTSNAEPLHNLPSFLNMLNDPDPIDDMNDGPFG